MKVLHVHSGNLYGGVETLMMTLAQGGHLCPSMGQYFALSFEDRLSRELRASGIPVYPLGKTRISHPLTLLNARRRLGVLLRKGFDMAVCHSAWSQAIFGPVVRSARIPLVYWFHDTRTSYTWLDRWARRTRPDFGICNSRFTLDGIPQWYPGLSAEVLYCPVAPPERPYSSRDRAEIRARLNTADGATVIAQVGRWESHKGHLLHLEALAALRDLPGWICWQVGGIQRDEERAYLSIVKERAAQLGLTDRVAFVGWQPEIPRVLAAADIYCQPNTDAEPFGITFVEALFAELPVVTTALGGPREIVDDSCGFLVRPGDPSALSIALRRLIKDATLRRALGANGPTRASRLCSPAKQIDRLRRLLSDARSRSAASAGAPRCAFPNSDERRSRREGCLGGERLPPSSAARL